MLGMHIFQSRFNINQIKRHIIFIIIQDEVTYLIKKKWHIYQYIF